jgi:uncharacterized membrane-anchored protein YhcB (DUF1043 family)
LGIGGKIMKKLFSLCIIVIFLLFTTAGVVAAEGNTGQITKTEVEKLINEKLSTGTPLTKEELQEEVNRLKDEKIADLEGNINKVIGFITLFITVTSVILVGVTAIIGVIFNSLIGKKVTKIEALENTISTTKTDIETRHKQVEEYHKQAKEFAEETVKVKRQLSQNERLLVKREGELEDLRKYVATIENIANSSMVINRFLIEKQQSLNIIEETREVIHRPQKNPNFVIMKLSEKLRKQGELNDLESVTEHLEYLVENLNNEEESLMDKIQRFKSTNELYINSYDEPPTLHEEVESNFVEWKAYLDDIIKIKSFWENHLQMNPINKPTE